MTCDSGERFLSLPQHFYESYLIVAIKNLDRPCARCIKRNIGHLCHDESKDQPNEETPKSITPQPSETDERSRSASAELTLKVEQEQELKRETRATLEISSQGTAVPLSLNTSAQSSPEEWPAMLGHSTDLLTNLTTYQRPLFYSEGAGSEFSSLNDFLTMIEDIPSSVPIDEQILLSRSQPAEVGREGVTLKGELAGDRGHLNTGDKSAAISDAEQVGYPSLKPEIPIEQQKNLLSLRADGNLTLTTPTKQIQMTETAKDKFFLTAADPADGPGSTPEERLKQVINAKLEAGLLEPFNYVKGYARLQRYMDRYMSPASRQRILKPLSIFRPAFRAIAQTLIDVDLVLVEEAFERMLLDYDRVFTSMAIPACLWRRTGEIYRGNKEFAALVEVPVEDLRDGKIAIYEVLSEDSAVNYWEKYGNIAFDSGQKAVLTSCTLETRDRQTLRPCCFSFTIRRDRYNIPSCIIGNFIPVRP